MGKVLVIKGADFSTNKVDTIVIDAQVTITVNKTGNGTVQGTGTYELGESVTLVAKPADGYVFNGWSDLTGGEKYNPSRIVVAAPNTVLACEFAAITVSEGYASTIPDSNKLQITKSNAKRAMTPQLFGRYTIECGSGFYVHAITYYKPSDDVPNHASGGYTDKTIVVQDIDMQSTNASTYTIPSGHENDYSIVTFRKGVYNSDTNIDSSEYGNVIASLTYL